jgi:hypothetical protein
VGTEGNGRGAAQQELYGHLILSALAGAPLRLPAGVNPDHLLWRICEHGLAGLLDDALRKETPAADPALSELASRVRAEAIAQEASVRGNLRAAAEVAGALENQGVAAVFVKGVALALSAYERPALRAFGDLDLLVHPDSLPAARAALASLGFVPDSEGPSSSMEAAFVRAGPGVLPVAVDLHWAFVEDDGPQAAVRIPVRDILARRRIVESVPVPTVEDSLLLAAANLVRSRVDRMVLIVDFCKLAAAQPDWDRVLERAASWRLKTALWLGLSRAERLIGAGIPPALRAAIAPSSWRRRWIDGLLAGSALWSRRKIRHRFVAYGLPFLCLDSWGDFARTLSAGRGRALVKLGFAPRRDD